MAPSGSGPRPFLFQLLANYNKGSIIMRSAVSHTMDTSLESPVAYPSLFLLSSISVDKPSYTAPSKRSIVVHSAVSLTMDTSLESPVAYPSFFLQSAVSVDKPSYVVQSMRISPNDEGGAPLRSGAHLPKQLSPDCGRE